MSNVIALRIAAFAAGLAMSSCASHEAGVSSPNLGESHVDKKLVVRVPALALTRPTVVRAHMQSHFDDLRQVERLLVAGQLTLLR